MNKQNEPRQAFVLRIAPGGVDRVKDALRDRQTIIGWSKAAELLDPALSWNEFREVLRQHYYAKDKNLRRAGSAAGNMWRFLREMGSDDFLIVPHGSSFYVARVDSEAKHYPTFVGEDTAFRRDVTWLNDGNPIPRSIARAALQSRMKTYGTCAYASDLLDEISDALTAAQRKDAPTFEADLHARLVQEALDEIQSGRLDSFGFENLVRSVLTGLGAEDARVIARSMDKGADILATFGVAGAFRFVVAVQAKHYLPKPPVSVSAVDQLIQGIEAESADLGMIVTSGSISDKAARRAEKYFEDKGVKIELVDGPQLAAMIVEGGLTKQ